MQIVKFSLEKKGTNMKTLINTLAFKTILVISILFSFNSLSYSGIYPWSPLQKITSGYNDKNPAFGTKQEYFYTLFDWEFMVFERHQDSTSNICVLKMGTSGPLDSVIYISDNTGLNRNPSISYFGNSGFFQSSIIKAVAMWEYNRNGRWDIYASYFNKNTGWQTPFPVDTSNADKSHPQSVCIDTINFGITYEKDNDIIFKIINGQTHNIIYDTNLTSNESAICTNPFLSLDYDFYVSYQKQKADSNYQIDYRRSATLPNWTQPDTIAYEGNNINNGFVNYFSGLIGIFSSDRTGNYNIYGNVIGSFQGQKPLTMDSLTDNFDYESYLFPIVTDGGFYNHANVYNQKTDSNRILFSDYFLLRDSVSVSDSSSEISLTMNRGIKFGMFDAFIWVVFNKDSLNFSNLYGKSLQIIILDINKISSTVPEKFELYQNFPNPFNPVTKIKFDIPQITGNNSSDVKLIIYDQLGREVESLLNKQLGSGTYEVTWDAGKYSSGIYFYKLIFGNFSETKKLMLLK